MKKIYLTGLLLCLCLIGCEKKQTTWAPTPEKETVSDISLLENSGLTVIEHPEDVAEKREGVEHDAYVADITTAKSTNDDMPVLSETTFKTIDYDFSTMNKSSFDEEFIKIKEDHKPYVDKIIKISGFTDIFETDGKKYYSCILPDATENYIQGFEFVLNDDWKKYDDYPHKGQGIIVVGKFSEYEENGETYYCLTDAELVEK